MLIVLLLFFQKHLRKAMSLFGLNQLVVTKYFQLEWIFQKLIYSLKKDTGMYVIIQMSKL